MGNRKTHPELTRICGVRVTGITRITEPAVFKIIITHFSLKSACIVWRTNKSPTLQTTVLEKVTTKD